MAFEKAGLFQDESYTFMLAHESWLYSVPDEGVVYHNGEPWRSWASADHLFDVDFGKLYQNAAEDNHPPLYFALFAFAYSLFPGATTPVIGVLLNTVFSLFGTVLLYFLCRALGARWQTAVGVCAVWAVNAGMANCTVYLRMYCLLSVFFVAAALLSVRHLRARRSGWGLTALTLLATTVGFLTQYFFVLFAFPLYLLTGILLLAQRRSRCALKFAAATLGGVACGMLLFPPSISHLFSSMRGQEALERAATGDSFGAFLAEDWRLLNDGVFGGLLPLALVVIAVLLVFCLARRRTAHAGRSTVAKGDVPPQEAWWPGIVLLAVSSAVFVTMVARVAPYASIRYLMAVNPILLSTTLLALFAAARWALPQLSFSKGVALLTAVGCAFAVCGWAHGIKYLDQETDSVAALYGENDALVAVSVDTILQESLLPDALEYGTSVYFYCEETFDEFDLTQLGDGISLYVDPNVDPTPYLEEVETYPGATITYAGETIDHYAVYDVQLR